MNIHAIAWSGGHSFAPVDIGTSPNADTTHPDPVHPPIDSAMFCFFPDEGRIYQSDSCIAENFLGHEFLRSVFSVRYDSHEQLFLLVLKGPADALQIANQYLDAVHQSQDSSAATIIDIVDPVHGSISLLFHSRFLCGVVGSRDKEAAHWRLGIFRRRISDLERAAIRVDLPKQWKFSTGDDQRYPAPAFDDRGWETIRVAAYWETVGHNGYDGVAWYRTTVTVPSALRTASVGGFVAISLGRIDDYDSTYVNGTLSGHTENASTPRIYLIPHARIAWDSINTIAVRVDDIGGGGGLDAGPYYIKPAGTSDLVRIHAGTPPTEIRLPGTGEVQCRIQFELPQSCRISGKVGVRVVNMNSRSTILDTVWHCTLDSSLTSVQVLSFFASERGSYHGRFWFTADGSTDTAAFSSVIAHTVPADMRTQLTHPVVQKTVPDKAFPISYEHIHLSGYLEKRIQSNVKMRLLRIDEEGILDGFINRPGNQDWANEYAGKYLGAASQAWRYTRDSSLKSQMDRIADVLLSCQKNDGYLGTYLPENYWLSWDVWGHKYDMTGLLEYYRSTGHRPALEGARRIGDLLCRTFGNEPGKLSIVSSGAWHGMAATSVLDPMTDLYLFTGDKPYLDFCKYIIDAYELPDAPQIISKLAARAPLTTIAGGKAYEFLSNILGVVKLYAVTGDRAYLQAAEEAWMQVSRSRLYITGSTSSGEVFRDEGDLPGGADAFICEGCVTTEWFHLNAALFMLTRQPRYMDAMETTLYNHLLAAENPQTGDVSYFTPLQGERHFRGDIFGNCCLASIPRGITVIPDVVYTVNSDNGLSINIYAPGSAECVVLTDDGEDLPVRLNVATSYPESGKIRIAVRPQRTDRFDVQLRVPSWCDRFTATVDGTTYRGKPGRYLTINRIWGPQTEIAIHCDLTVHVLNGGPNYPKHVAVKRGPQIFSADAELNPSTTLSKQWFIDPKTFRPSTHTLLQPPGWIGSQFYSISTRDESGHSRMMTLVPFADAGQTGGSVQVWLPK